VLAEAQQLGPDLGLDAEAVVHQLEEEVVGAEDVPELAGGLRGPLEVADP